MSDRNSSEQVEKKATSPASRAADPDAMMHEVLKAWKEQQGTKSEHALPTGTMKGAAGAITCAEIIGKSGPDKIDMCAEKIDWKDGSIGKGSKVDLCAEKIDWKDGPGKGSKVDLCAEKIDWKDGPGKGSKADLCAELIKLPTEKGSQGKDVNCAAHIDWPNQLKPQHPHDGTLPKIGDGSSTVNTCAAIIKPGKLEPSTVNTCAAVIKLGKPDPIKEDTCAAIIKNFPGDK